MVTTIQRLRNKPLADAYKPILNLNPFVPVLLLLPVYGVGYLVTKTSLGAASSLAAYVLPFLHILSVILPALFLVLIAARKLESGSPQRRSGVLAAGVALGPFVILLLETLALVAVIIIVSLYIANQPELYEQLMDLAGEITGIQGSMEDLLRLITPFLSSPVVILGTLTFISVIAPIIEELFKPVGVWILAKKSISPAEGFAAGAISGAGFAIFESLMLNAGVDDWLMGSVVRIGTSVIHIATTAMSGWALATAWRSGKYLRLVLVFLGVVSVHGLWNGLAVITIFHELGAAEGIQDALPLMGTVAVLSPYILIGLTIAGFILLFLMNRHLRQTDSPETMLIESELTSIRCFMEWIQLGIDFVLHLDKYLGEIIARYDTWTYLILFMVIFMETGFVITPFLPGDSLLFAAGTFASPALGSPLNIWVLLLLLIFAAILGDTVNYWIGHYIGPRAFSGNVRFLKKEYLDRTHVFFEKYGGKTIVLARFVPIVRTFAPFVAGVGAMSYGKFLTYNVVGGVAWVLIFTLAGYFFGNLPFVKDNFSFVVVAIILISVLPMVYEFLKERFKRSPRQQESSEL